MEFRETLSVHFLNLGKGEVASTESPTKLHNDGTAQREAEPERANRDGRNRSREVERRGH